MLLKEAKEILKKNGYKLVEARQAKKIDNSGNFAVILGSCYPTPKFFNSHAPVGTSDEVIKKIQENSHKSDAGEILGFYPTKKKAEQVALSVTERILKSVTDTYKDKGDAAYMIEYRTILPYVVDHTDDNKEWCSAIRCPGDAGYLYKADKDVRVKISTMRRSMLDFLKRAAEEERDEARIRREWATSKNNPFSANFKNVFAHH